MEKEMHFEILENGWDYVVCQCNHCEEIFYSSPCGEQNVEWDEERKCLYTVCPNGCYDSKKIAA